MTHFISINKSLNNIYHFIDILDILKIFLKNNQEFNQKIKILLQKFKINLCACLRIFSFFSKKNCFCAKIKGGK